MNRTFLKILFVVLVILAPVAGFFLSDLLPARQSSEAANAGAGDSSAARAQDSASAGTRETTAEEAIPRGLPIDGSMDDETYETSRLPQGGFIDPENFSMLDSVHAIFGEHATYEFEKLEDTEYLKVNFKQLSSYEFVEPDPEKLKEAADPLAVIGDQIPKELRALDNQKVLVAGFMMPFGVDEEGRLVSFALSQSQAFCCYGIPPALNEFILVEVGDAQGTFQMDVPVAVYGTLSVKEETLDGYVLSLYQMQAKEVIAMPELIKRVKPETLEADGV